MLAMSKRQSVRFGTLEKGLGYGAWAFSLKRREFSLFFEVFKLLKRHRRAGTKKSAIIRLTKKVRQEFEAAAALSAALEHSLDFKPAEDVTAVDASTEGWAVVTKSSGRGFMIDTGLEEPPAAVQNFLCSPTWRLRKTRRFRKRLDHILPGEICAARQGIIAHARREPGCDLTILTDNSNVYYALRKGRSSSFRLNELCRIVLAVEVIQQVRIHIRWIPTKMMPADIYTRERLLGEQL